MTSARTVGAHSCAPVLLLGVVLLGATSCAQMREQEVREVVTEYLEAEVTNDYHRQAILYDLQSSIILPPPVGDISSPFDPKRLVSYTINKVTVEGATAQAAVDAAFQVTGPGGSASALEHHNLTIYLVHETDRWKINELKTRTQALNLVKGPGAGDTWLTIKK